LVERRSARRRYLRVVASTLFLTASLTGCAQHEAGMAQSYAFRGRYDESMASARKALQLDSRNAWAWYWLGVGHFRKGEYDEAIDALGNYVRLEPKPFAEAYRKLGQAFLAGSQYEQAIRMFTLARTARDPDIAVLEQELRTARQRLEEADRAKAAAIARAGTEAERRAREEAARLAGARAEAIRAARERTLQEARARREVQDRAERETKEVLRRPAGLSGLDAPERGRRASEAIARGEAAEQRGALDDAFAEYSAAWRDIERAEAELWNRVQERILRLYPRLATKPESDETARRHALHGDTHFDANRFDEAVGAYTRSLALAPWNAVARFNLALALASQQRHADAIDEMRRFLWLVPDGPHARTAQDTIYKWEASLAAAPAAPTPSEPGAARPPSGPTRPEPAPPATTAAPTGGRAWLGVSVQPLTPELAATFGANDARGALVADVASGSPAEQAGLRPGDIILEFRGERVIEPRDLVYRISLAEPGAAVPLKVLRDRGERTVEVRLGAAPGEFRGAAAVATPEWLLRADLVPLTPAKARQLGLQETGGVLVVAVERGGPAEASGLSPDDVIREANRQPIRDLLDLQGATHGLGEGDLLLLRVARRGSLVFITVKLGGR